MRHRKLWRTPCARNVRALQGCLAKPACQHAWRPQAHVPGQARRHEWRAAFRSLLLQQRAGVCDAFYLLSPEVLSPPSRTHSKI